MGNNTSAAEQIEIEKQRTKQREIDAADRQKAREEDTKRLLKMQEEQTKRAQEETKRAQSRSEESQMAHGTAAQKQQLMDAKIKHQVAQSQYYETLARERQEDARASREREAKRQADELQAKKKQREEQEAIARAEAKRKEEEFQVKKKQAEEARKLLCNEAMQTSLKEKASQEFQEFKALPDDACVIKSKEHNVVLVYEQLNTEVVATHCETMFSELPPEVRKEVTRMATNAMKVVKDSRRNPKAGGNISEIVDCQKTEASFAVQGKGYTTRYTLAFRFHEITEATARQAGWLDWFRNSHPAGKSCLVGVAYKFEFAAGTAKSGSVDLNEMQHLKAMGVV